MKRLLFIILLVALTACGPSNIPPTPTPTLTPIPTPTEIPEVTRPFGDGLIGEGKIGPWVEANKIDASQALIENAKMLSPNGEVLAFEVKDAQGQTAQMVFVLERDVNGQIVKRFVAWNKDDLGVKRLADNGIVNDLDELVALPGGLSFGVMGADGVIESVILIDANGNMALVDNFIQVMQQGDKVADEPIKASIKSGIKEIGDAFGGEQAAPPEGWNADIAALMEMNSDQLGVLGITDVKPSVGEDGYQQLKFHAGGNFSLDEITAKLESECKFAECNNVDGDTILLQGIHTGDMEVIFKEDGLKEVVTSVETWNNLLDGRVQKVVLRLILGKRNNQANYYLYKNLGLGDDVKEFDLKIIAKLFKAGNVGDFVVRMRTPDSDKATKNYQLYGARFNDGKYYQAVEAWFKNKFDPAKQGDLKELIVTTSRDPNK
jgi:hypothetical protein